ncbi:MAG: FixH family protein [Pseudomonadota bacterium]
MTAPAATPGFTIKGWHVLVALVLFFGIVIGTDALFMVLAYRTFSGQVAANPYEAGIAYNRTLEQKARQAALGWKASLGDADDGLTLTVQDAAGRPVDGLTVSATLERPATEQGRRRLALRPLGDGRYGVRATLDGAWDVRVAAVAANGDRFEASRRLVRP